jgi:hypothetical protein
MVINRKRNLPSGRKEKNRCWGRPIFHAQIYFHAAVLRD